AATGQTVLADPLNGFRIRQAARSPDAGRRAGRTWTVKHCATALRTCRYATPDWAMTCSTAAGQPDLAAQARSGAARAGVEDLAVQVHVELDRAEPAGRPPDKPAERPKTPFARARLPRVADVVVRAVLGLTDPLAGRLCPGDVRGEVVPAARGPPGQAGASDPVLAAAAQRGGEALVIRVALLDHRAVRVAAPPPGKQRRVLPHAGHPVAVDLVERVGEEVLRVTGRQVEPGHRRRVEAVDVVQLDGVETLGRAHPDPLVQHRLERVELAEVQPPFL